MPSPAPTNVLVVSDRVAASPELLDAIRSRAARGPIAVHLLVPNPAPAEWHPAHPERHAKAQAAQRVLAHALPELRAAAGVPSRRLRLHAPRPARRDRGEAPRRADRGTDHRDNPAARRRLAARRPAAPRGASRAPGDHDHRRRLHRPARAPHDRPHTRAADAQQGARGHALLLDHQDHVHDRRRDGGRLPQREPRLRPDEHHLSSRGRCSPSCSSASSAPAATSPASIGPSSSSSRSSAR